MKNKTIIKNVADDNTAAIYCRVSTKEQEETGYSLPSQERLLTEYTDRKNYKIVKVFAASESASGKKLRKIFNEMIEYIVDNNIQNLVVEKVDRLTRNYYDAIVANDWIEEDDSRKIHFVKQNLVIHKNAKSDEKFRWDIEIAIAKKYIANLSEESKKGIREKVLMGYYHGAYKAGYKCIGEKGKRVFVSDDATFPLWKRLSELYMTGEYTMKKLVKAAYDSGLRSRYGKKIYKSQIESFLKDPFYHGVLIHNGVVLNENGKHERMRTQEEFDLIQEIRLRKKSPFYSKHMFLFSKMVECGECKGMVTSEVQKGHVYCHCTHYNGCTQKKYTRQEVIEESLVGVMEVFETITDEEAQEIVLRIRQSHQDEIKYKKEVLDNLEGGYRGLQNKIDRLYDDRLSGIITDVFWKEKNIRLQSEQKDIIDQINKLKTQEAKYFELGINILELARKAKTIYKNEERTAEEKRMLLKSIFKDITLKNGEVTYTLHEPVRKLYERLTSSKNIFEPKKAFANAAKASSESKITSMLPR